MASMNPGEDFHGWLPIRIWRPDREWRVDWCWFGEQRLTRPFFRDDVDQALRLPFNQAFRRETGLQALLDWQAASPGLSPGAFIFHASRCGSTLMARMLAGLERNVVLSEPPPLDNLLRAHRTDPDIAPHQPALVAALLSAFGQRRRGDEQRLLVKLDAWNVFEAPLLQQLYPETPRLFLYRDPLEIAVSQLRQPGLHCVPGLLGPSALDDTTPTTPTQFIARTIGRILEGGLELCHAHGGIPVNYLELPEVLRGRLQPWLGLKETDEPGLHEIASFDAKQPGFHFNADGQSKRDAADATLRAAIEHWARKPFEALEKLRQSASETTSNPGEAYACSTTPLR
ncbi:MULTISPECIES: sulfotransferase family protein [unclassified Pseudomonas]|uniref:sulfotransferase family protein n=1 Tax=unclassified Pseudomonas TaxID=196821 RepID=UPI00244A06CB|nr:MULTISPECIES: sulfotransferase family protein [unclassified Pseudomonas]MDH0897657.1 sulfotransferase family protein [Pseudomonas sp. GD03875]MDH1067740.1 sulfotransferase family protein [Pseudomonas sp. GD03985]